MNRLVDALTDNPQLIDLFAGLKSVPFASLAESLGDALLSRAERDVLDSDIDVIRRIGRGYLPTITAPEWEGALSAAEDNVDAREGWWTIMVAAPSGGVGITIPQDASATELVALFTGPVDSAETLVYDVVDGSLVSLFGSTHCGPPSRGRCAVGICGGCRAKRMYIKSGDFAIMCRCSDQVR